MISENITILNIDEKIKNKLIDNTILTFKDLEKKTKKDLKNIGLDQKEIKELEVRIQLKGYSLKKSL